MLDLGTDVFSLAVIQLRKERKKTTIANIIDYAIKIRHYLDDVERCRKSSKVREERKAQRRLTT